jgi:hypothetical protein
MSDPREEVALIPSGQNYILRRTESDGKKTQIELTKANLLSFRPLLVRECLQILQSLATPDLRERGVSPSVDMAVRNFVVANDLHQVDIYFLDRASA